MSCTCRYYSKGGRGELYMYVEHTCVEHTCVEHTCVEHTCVEHTCVEHTCVEHTCVCVVWYANML